MDRQIYIGESLEIAKVLESETYKGYNYFIVTTGTHPCAYVQLDEEKDAELIDTIESVISVHGGITWCGTFGDNRFGEDNDPFVIGWDYAHLNDLFYLEGGKALHRYGEISYTIDEIRKDAYSVIEQIIELKMDSILNTNMVETK